MSPAFCQIWIEPDHQVNDPNGPDGDPNTPDDDNPLNGTYKAQFEPWIAVHPWYPGLAFGAWNDYSRTEEFRSDGFGTSNLAVSDPPPWTHDLVVDIPTPPPPGPPWQWQQSQGDPGCAVGGNGLFYQAGADWGPGPLRVYFARSTTGGGTQGWDVGFLEAAENENMDTPKVVGDFSTQLERRNRVYLLWAPSITYENVHRIMLSQDQNSGDTWIHGGATLRELSDPTATDIIKKGPVGAVGPLGEFYVAWYEKNPSCEGGGNGNIWFNGTKEPFPANGPPTFFGPTRLVACFDSLNGGRTDDRTNFKDSLASWPAIAVDTSGCKFNGNIYIAYVEEESVGPVLPNRVKVIVGRPSPTGPPTWSPPVIVNWDAPGHSLQWFVAIAVDAKGRVAVIWHDTRQADEAIVNQQPYDVYFAYSLDGGATWSANRRVTGASSLPRPAPGQGPALHKVGEYNGMAAAEDSFYPIWMDLRRWSRNGADEAGDIFATRIDVTAWPDFDGDCDVDLTGDYPVFESCYSGDGNPFPPGCGNADFDADGDVDGADFLIFQKLLTGDGNCLCGGGASEEPFTDDGGQTWYTRADVQAGLRDYCARHLLPLP